MIEVRCQSEVCEKIGGRLLFKAERFVGEIKCQCGAIQKLVVESVGGEICIKVVELRQT